jgi:hypothetical protein
METLQEAYWMAKKNDGAPGTDVTPAWMKVKLSGAAMNAACSIWRRSTGTLAKPRANFRASLPGDEQALDRLSSRTLPSETAG